MLNPTEIFGLIFAVAHLEDTTSGASFDTNAQVSTADTPWHNMYRLDRYARDRVMKSARLLLPFLKDGDLILDVGCFTQESRKYYPPWVKYLGLDEKAFHPETKVVNLNHGFEAIPATHALCLETLEHLADPVDCLESLSKCLGPDGYLVVSLPNEATLFHRLRCLLGTVDAGAFASEGKHLHLPSLRQAQAFLQTRFQIVRREQYISPSACGSRQAWLGRILCALPDKFWQILADTWPSLFARGWIFLLQNRKQADTSPQPDQAAQPSSLS